MLKGFAVLVALAMVFWGILSIIVAFAPLFQSLLGALPF